MSAEVGKRIVKMVWEDLIPSKIITEKSVENAATIAMAMGCSTNAIIHLIAMARRAGINFSMDDLDKKGREVPLIANIRPSGKDYLMEDFFYAGGILSAAIDGIKVAEAVAKSILITTIAKSG